ncbi:hypothetical protein INR49_006612 [Caranx melampygus]|nr:hypothetical protein INR49_006612 [Caranx melampygus]
MHIHVCSHMSPPRPPSPPSGALRVCVCVCVCVSGMEGHEETISYLNIERERGASSLFTQEARRRVMSCSSNEPESRVSNTVLHLDLVTGAVRRLMLSPDSDQPSSSSRSLVVHGGYKMCREFSHKNWLLFYKENGHQLEVLDVLEGRVHSISLPINLKSVFLVAEDRWLLVESDTNKKFLLTKPCTWGQKTLECVSSTASARSRSARDMVLDQFSYVYYCVTVCWSTIRTFRLDVPQL